MINLFYKGKQPNRKAIKVDVPKHRNRRAEADEEVDNDFEIGPTIDDLDNSSSTADSSKASDELESSDSEDDNSEQPSTQALAREASFFKQSLKYLLNISIVQKPRWGDDKGKQKATSRRSKSPRPAKTRKPSKKVIAAACAEVNFSTTLLLYLLTLWH